MEKKLTFPDFCIKRSTVQKAISFHLISTLRIRAAPGCGLQEGSGNDPREKPSSLVVNSGALRGKARVRGPNQPRYWCAVHFENLESIDPQD
jgi:hypothetical protein